jgi:hypothetical protein
MFYHPQYLLVAYTPYTQPVLDLDTLAGLWGVFAILALLVLAARGKP